MTRTTYDSLTTSAHGPKSLPPREHPGGPMKIRGTLANGKLCYHVLPLDKKPWPVKKKGKVI